MSRSLLSVIPERKVKPALTLEENPLSGADEAQGEEKAELFLLPPSTSRAQDVEERVAAARSEGWRQGLAETRAACTAEWEAERKVMQAEKEAACEQLSQAFSEQLQERLDAEINQMEERLAGALCGVLRPFLDERLLHLAVDDFRSTARELMSEARVEAPLLKGPEVLLELLRADMDTQQFRVVQDNEASELCLVLGDTVIETRVGAWLDRLKGAHEQ